MRNAHFVFLVLLVLSGCTSYGDYTSDAFDPGATSQETFTMDSANCQAEADIARSYDVHGIYGTHVERHEIFNRAYAVCMRKHGYALRDWSPDIAVPYSITP